MRLDPRLQAPDKSIRAGTASFLPPPSAIPEAALDLPLQAVSELVAMGLQITRDLLLGASTSVRDDGVVETSQQRRRGRSAGETAGSGGNLRM
jgi:hypothetical protein